MSLIQSGVLECLLSRGVCARLRECVVTLWSLCWHGLELWDVKT